eukprot:94356_1
MATTQVSPNGQQIQLEVNVEQNNEETEPDLPDAPSSPEEDEEVEVTPEPDGPDPCLPYISLLVILLLAIWPFLLTFLNYWTDWQLWGFIRSTRSDYSDVRDQILSSSANITTLTCSFAGQNSLSQFEEFLLNTSVITGCTCNYIDVSTASCGELYNGSWTTTNIDYEQCITHQNNINSTCLECSACRSTSVYAAGGPYYQYSVMQYDSIKDIKAEREKYCSPKKIRENIDSDVIYEYFTHCANACIVFFVFSGIWIICGLCSGCKVSYRDLYRSYIWCFKGEKPKKRSAYHKEHRINKDEFTLFVVATLLLHVFEDVVQCIVAIMFSIYKQSNGGSECIVGLGTHSYANSVELVPYTGGLSIVEIMTHDDVVRRFYLFSFLSVFTSGLYAVRLLNFDTLKIMTYPWWKNCLYVLAGILMGLMFLLLVLAPFWGAVWMSADFLYLTKGESAFLMWTFVAGLGGYLVSICMPLCFADQLDCGCECGDGPC